MSSHDPAFALAVFGVGVVLVAFAAWGYRSAGPGKDTYLMLNAALSWAGFGLLNLVRSFPASEVVETAFQASGIAVMLGALLFGYRAAIAKRREKRAG